MKQGRAAGAFTQRAERTDVVDMGVRVHEVPRPQSVCVEVLRDLRDVVTAVDDDRFAADRIAEHGAVAVQHPDRERLDDHWGGAIAKSRYWRSK